MSIRHICLLSLFTLGLSAGCSDDSSDLSQSGFPDADGGSRVGPADGGDLNPVPDAGNASSGIGDGGAGLAPDGGGGVMFPDGGAMTISDAGTSPVPPCERLTGSPTGALADYASLRAAYDAPGGRMPNFFHRTPNFGALEGRCFADDRPGAFLVFVLEMIDTDHSKPFFVFDLEGYSGLGFNQVTSPSQVNWPDFAPRETLDLWNIDEAEPSKIERDNGDFVMGTRVSASGKLLLRYDWLDLGVPDPVPNMMCELYREIVLPGHCIVAPDALVPGARGDALANGMPVLVSGDAGVMMVFHVSIPSGVPQLTIRTSGGSSPFGAVDIELYARLGAPPTTTQYDFHSNMPGTQEEIVVSSPAPGVYVIGVTGLDLYDDVELVSTW